MKRNPFLFFAVLIVPCINSCSTGKTATGNAVATDNSRLLTLGPLWATLYQQHAAEYKALCIQAYNMAYVRLDAALQQTTGKPYAVISDIDETILDNSPNTVHNSLIGKTYTDSSWVAWTKQAACDTVPGAPAFFKYAASRKVEVFYISNRMNGELPQTIANLQRYNMPNADAAHVLLKTSTSDKDGRRATVTANYNVLLYFGDNLGDYKGVFDKQTTAGRDSLVHRYAMDFGKQFIVLPNAVYGEWMGALINYRYAISNKEKADTMIGSLRRY